MRNQPSPVSETAPVPPIQRESRRALWHCGGDFDAAFWSWRCAPVVFLPTLRSTASPPCGIRMFDRMTANGVIAEPHPLTSERQLRADFVEKGGLRADLGADS